MQDLVKQLGVLADPHRLSIVRFLAEPVKRVCSRDDGVCACDLEAFLGLSQPTVSHHMKQLVEAGFVTAERQGRWVHYSLNGDAFREVREGLEPLERAAFYDNTSYDDISHGNISYSNASRGKPCAS